MRRLHVWDVSDPSPTFACGRMPVQGKDGALLYVASEHVSAKRIREVAPRACKRCMTRLLSRLARASTVEGDTKLPLKPSRRKSGGGR